MSAYRAPPQMPSMPKKPVPAWRRDLGPLLRPALTYHVWVFVSLVVFSLTILFLEGAKPENFLILGVFGFSTVVGVVAGQALAIWRARGCTLGCLGMLYLGFALLLSPVLTALGHIGVMLMVVLILTPVAFSGGLWSLASNRALPAAWLPMVYGIGSIFAIVENEGRVAAFRRGDKTAIWDAATALILLLIVTLLVVYLVQRERHRLHRWRFGPRALLEGTITERGSARPRLTVFGWLLMVLLALGLTGGTLLIAPYLFRTEVREGDRNGGSDNRPDDRPPPEPGDGNGGFGAAMEKMKEAAESFFRLLCPFLIALALGAAVVSAAWRPARRAFYVRYLRSPPWPVSPTRRIENAWRLIEIALEDIGLDRHPHEDARAFYGRSEGAIRAFNADLAPKVQEAAELRDRVAFGLGVSSGDADRLIAAAEWIFLDVEDRIEASKQAQAYWRKV